MVSSQPLSVKQLLALFEEDKSLQPERDNIKKAIISLQKDFEGRGVNLVEVASGFRFQADDRVAIIGTDSARENFFHLTVPESRIVKKNWNQN